MGKSARAAVSRLEILLLQPEKKSNRQRVINGSGQITIAGVSACISLITIELAVSETRQIKENIYF